MKVLVLCLLVLLALGLNIIGCSKDKKPEVPPVVVPPVVAPVADLCKAEGKAIECEAQLGHTHKLGCVVDGDYKPIYFSDINAAEVWANAKPEYLKIKMKDGSVKAVGPYAFGYNCKEL